MATLQDLQDVLAEQNQAILDEVAEINKAMDALKLDPNSMDHIVNSIRANTEAVRAIINEPLPEPEPESEPPRPSSVPSPASAPLPKPPTMKP